MTTDLPGRWPVDELAKMASWVARARRYHLIDPGEARDVAAVAFIERLYQPGPAPAAAELFTCAQAALNHEVERIKKDRGYDVRHPGQLAPQFWRYWIDPAGEPMDERITDRVACWQVFTALPERHQQVLWALAWADDYQAAADWIGCTRGAFMQRLSDARRAARELWACPESPAPLWGRDRRRDVERGSHSIMQQRRADRRRSRKEQAA